MTQTQETNKKRHWLWLALCLLAYVLPWTMNPGAGLTMGAYDFAELLNKRNVYDDVSYATMLLLRGQLVLLTAYVVTMIRRPFLTIHWFVGAAFGLLLVVAQLPPLTFINNTGDINQKMQAMLAGISGLIWLVGLSGVVWEIRHWARLFIGIAGFGTALFALVNAIAILSVYNLPSLVGFGGVVMIILYGVLIVWEGRVFAKARNRAEP
ncbi:MAG: hypothetical protein AAFN11_12435 [Chloroflexota bacterium]